MPKGHRARREPRKPKKKADEQPILSAPVFTSTEVEVVKKKRKPKQEES